MYGAIIGDIAGSIYEYDEFNNAEKGLIDLEKRLEILSKKDLIEDDCFFSDDTILTIAILDSILKCIPYADKLKEYGLKYGTEKLNKPNYFEYMFSNNFTQWCKGEEAGNSVGNGCMMRIAPIGFLYDSLEEVEENSELATKPSHNNAIAIRASKVVSSVIYLARTGSSKSEIIEFLKDRYDINLDYNLEELRKTYLFDATCNVLEICLYIVLSSNDYEAAIRNAISIGGDTDTIACIVGGMAESLYGVPKHLIEIAKNKLPIEFNELLENGYKRCNMQNFNYHTHTYRCGHTQKDMTDEDFVNEFIKKGFKKIAFTDHCPQKQRIDKRTNMRMEYSQINEYLESVKFLKNKYKDKIEIESGFEVEYLPGEEENLLELKQITDKLVLGQHFIYDDNNTDLKIFRKHDFNDYELIKYANYIKKALELRIPDIIVHPDLYMLNRDKFGEIEKKTAEIICEAAEKYNIPLEINLTEPSMFLSKLKDTIKYPCKGFWEVASKYNVKVIYGIDAHYKAQIRQYEESINIANKIIGRETIDKLNFCKEL